MFVIFYLFYILYTVLDMVLYKIYITYLDLYYADLSSDVRKLIPVRYNVGTSVAMVSQQGAGSEL